MKILLDSLPVRDAIARKGSVAAAAEELDRLPSAITYTIQKLGQDVGVTTPGTADPDGEALLRAELAAQIAGLGV